jgi:hypothetical protein
VGVAAVGATLALAAGGAAATGSGSGARLLETLKVSNTNPSAISSATVLKASHKYRLVASGTVSDWCDGGSTPCTDPLVLEDGVDALYCYATWRCPRPEPWRQLQINGVGLDELAGKTGAIPFSASHVYTVEITGIAGALTLVASDATWSAGGNSGSFTLSITDLGEVWVGVGFVPFLSGGDEVEETMRLLVGSFGYVDRIYNPATSDALFSTLVKLGRAGKTVGVVVIAGHGSKDNPRIDLSADDVEPADVDLPGLQRRIAVFQRADALGRLTSTQRQELQALRARVAFLRSVSAVMKPGAEVLLVNCSPAATAKGQEFLRNLAQVMLGRHGGTLVASRSDVELGQVRWIAGKIRAFLKTGENVSIGDYFASGDWVRFAVNPGQ